jgi:hypothetical protein
MIEVIFKIFLTDYIDFQGFITKRIQKPLLIEYKKANRILYLSAFDVLKKKPTIIAGLRVYNRAV